MILKLRIGHWRFTFSIAPVVDVIGVNSKLPNGNHIPMWDFDYQKQTDVMNELYQIQVMYQLPNIYLLQTHPSGNFIAYCFKRCTWRKTVEIVAATKLVDFSFFKWAVYREHFTLRVSPKCERKPKLIWVLRSDTPEDCYVTDLKSWVKYETLQDNWAYKEITLGER